MLADPSHRTSLIRGSFLLGRTYQIHDLTIVLFKMETRKLSAGCACVQIITAPFVRFCYR
jgi:hypothetical protein